MFPLGGGLHTCIGNEFARVRDSDYHPQWHNLVRMYEWSQVSPEETVITRQPMPYPSMDLPIKIKPIKALIKLIINYECIILV